MTSPGKSPLYLLCRVVSQIPLQRLGNFWKDQDVYYDFTCDSRSRRPIWILMWILAIIWCLNCVTKMQAKRYSVPESVNLIWLDLTKYIFQAVSLFQATLTSRNSCRMRTHRPQKLTTSKWFVRSRRCAHKRRARPGHKPRIKTICISREVLKVKR